MSTIIVMPQLGESVAEGIIGKWLKNEGDAVERDEPIVEIITDKVNAEIPSPVAGVLERIVQPEGATVAVGQEIAIIGSGGNYAEQPAATAASGAPPSGDGNGQLSSPASSAPTAVRAVTLPSAAATETQSTPRTERVRSSPLVRRLAEQHGIDLAEVPGTGIGGRVSKHDILSFVEQRQRQPAPAAAISSAEQPAPQLPPQPRPLTPTIPRPEGQPGPAPAHRVPQISTTREPGPTEELIPVSALRKMIAGRMVQSVSTIPHATTMSEVDMTNVVRYREAHKDEFRRREGVPLSYVAFVIKATVEALKAFPLVNAEWAGDHIIRKREININVAVDASEGLTTPVIRHADERSLAGISRAIQDLATRARERKLTIEDMQNGTFTVNNTGALGSVSGVSIINYPQGGILSAAAIVKRPVVVEQDGQDLIAVRSMMNLSFTFDHRLMDGGYAAGFVAAVKTKLEGWSMDYPLY
jgi:2-oxoisovalerate dehydrogenase E2 component (dihydrolipoyl transacylase)